jgi:hypothetical protein
VCGTSLLGRRDGEKVNPTSAIFLFKEILTGHKKKPPSNDSRGHIPPQLEFFGKFVSGFENLIKLSVILRHLEAKSSILRC